MDGTDGERGESYDPLHNLTHPKQRLFIEAYRAEGTVLGAERLSEVSRSNHYFWMASDASYRQAFRHQRMMNVYELEDALIARLIHGMEDPVFGKDGEVVGYRIKYDNSNAMRYLEAAAPEIFRRRTEVATAGPTGTDLTPDRIDDEVRAMDATIPEHGGVEEGTEPEGPPRPRETPQEGDRDAD